MPYPTFISRPFAHQLPQRPANLVIAAQIVEIRAQKHIAAFAVDRVSAAGSSRVSGFMGHLLMPDNIRHLYAKINVKSIYYR